MSWPTVQLGEVCQVVSGGTPKTSNPSYWNGDVPWVTPKDLSELDTKMLREPSRTLTREGFESCSAKMLPAKSVLLSSRAPIGLVAINETPVCTNQGFKSLVPTADIVSADYLYWWLRLNRSALERLGRGATFKEVSKKIVEGVEFPLPPLAEQKRIAAILDEVDALRARRRESIAQLDVLLRSTFLSLFGDPGDNAMEWPIVRLGEIVERLEGGKNVAKSETATKFRVLKVSAVTSGVYRPEESKWLPSEFKVPQSYLVRSGDLLISRANTAELIGATAFVWSTPPDMVLPDKVWRMVWKTAAPVEPLYICHLSRDPDFRRELGARATGTSGSMKNIAKPKLLSMSVPLPPLSLQRRFAAIVRCAEGQRARMLSHLAGLDELFDSIQRCVFNGEL